ncbi:MAG: DEAD/DEAH box helicase [Pseudomonadota bacterium]
MADVATLSAHIAEALTPEFRASLLARGQARSMIWRNGVLPEGSPEFSDNLSYDLISYGFALITQGLQLLDLGERSEAARAAFEHAAAAVESAIMNAEPSPENDFHRLVAGAAYHLAGFSARAYSVLHRNIEAANLSAVELCIARLILRDLEGVAEQIADTRLGGAGSDENLLSMISEAFPEGAGPLEDAEVSDDPEPAKAVTVDAVDLALTDTFMGALSSAMLAFARGDRELLDQALAQLGVGLTASGEIGLIAQYWCHRLAIHLLDDLWDKSLHNRLPKTPPTDGMEDWVGMRDLFLASLYRRSRAEIELWPSQLDAAARAVKLDDNMVVALPTSAGKTRIAELCILACLAAKKRVVFVTPLRALSAQTEVNLARTFQPLGKSVSSLYGSIGVSEADGNVMRERDIIVATPEKLDFALRNEPSLLNDVGLIVLDEGHMIGLGEREVRYEVQIQRLRRRADADDRRIVCLSAILPDGDQLEDFTAWLTGDQADGLLKKNWRPTRLRYGEIAWVDDSAELKVSVGGERPWVRNFITPKLPRGRRTKQFPSNQRELCIASAWRLMDDGHSVLIFCPQRRSVEPFAREIVDLHERGCLASVRTGSPAALETALAIGREWLGPDSCVLKCLELGVAIHHGALPTQYRKEVERLLREGVLRLTVSSPTLAQGLNLSATSLLFHSLSRNRGPIDISEFRNVVGRAGRAYIDVEGLALYPMFDDVVERRAEWEAFVANEGGKEMESGLLRLVFSLFSRMLQKVQPKDVDTFLAYVAGGSVWAFPDGIRETARQREVALAQWTQWLPTLDTAILGMLGEHDVDDSQIEAKLDEVLNSSLWTRRMLRRSDPVQRALKSILVTRARHVWGQSNSLQRRGYFLAGIGLDTGLELDARAAVLNDLLADANGHVLVANEDDAIKTITDFAEIVFEISPFVPDPLPVNWRAILDGWLRGKPFVEIGATSEEALRFVENGLIYKLPWAMEAVRVRALANDDVLEGGFTMADVELGLAVAAVETGSLNVSASLLMRSGFSSRTGAIAAVRDGVGSFTTLADLREWLASDAIKDASKLSTWPTSETHALWRDFVISLTPVRRQRWRRQEGSLDVEWDDGLGPYAPTPLQIAEDNEGDLVVLDSSFERCGVITNNLDPTPIGLLLLTASDTVNEANYVYFGPGDLGL